MIDLPCLFDVTEEDVDMYECRTYLTYLTVCDRYAEHTEYNPPDSPYLIWSKTIVPSKLPVIFLKRKHIPRYSPIQRAELIKRFKEKKMRRDWSGSFRYVCRRQFAAARARVKGRFIPKTHA